jgi:opacity protein-like surface antigen
MLSNTKAPITKTMFLAGLALALLFGAATADAQDRAERWEFSLGALYQLGTSADFDGGTHVETEDEFGFAMTFGYNINEKLLLSFGFGWADVGYDATVIEAEGGGELGISGEYENMALTANLIFNLTEGKRTTPYIGAGIGWSWIDTNIPTGLPETACWWDPWWGYVCYTEYPTATTDSMTYQATLGLRYEINYSTFMRLGYSSRWLDIDTGSPRFDVIGLEIGWIF